MKKKETVFKERVQKRLKAIPNSWWVKVQQVGINGTPDILGTINGVFVAIELKTDDGILSKLQGYNIDKIAKTGAIALVMSPADFEDKLKILDKTIKACVSF